MDNHKGYYLDSENYVHNDIKNTDNNNFGIKERVKTYLDMNNDEVKKFRDRADVKKEQLNFTEVLVTKKKEYITLIYILK